MKPSLNSYFAGVGLFDLGLEQGGVEIRESFEIDADCCKVAKHNGRHTRQMDMRLKLVRDEKPSDIIAATYPCTKYSTIADIHGARTGDELYLHFFRHLAIKSPECYVLENVPGMRKFPVVMEAMTKLPSYCPDSKAYRMIGNGVSVPLGRWVGKELVRYFNYSSSVQKTINSYRHGCRFN